MSITRETIHSPIVINNDMVLVKQSDIHMYISNKTEPLNGTLYITTENIIFLSSAAQYTIPYECVALHALSSDTNTFQYPCVYCQIDHGVDNTDDDDDDGQSDNDSIDELRFVSVSNDRSVIDSIYDHMCKGSSLHPSGNDDDIMNDADHQWITSDNINEVLQSAQSNDNVPRSKRSKLTSNDDNT